MFMQILKSILYSLMLCCFCWASAQNYDFFVESHDDTEDMFDAAYPKITTDYSVLHNLFFQDDRWRVYNYTAYQTNQFSHKMLTGDTSNLSLDDFSVSLGYGIVYQLNQNNRLGYEYLSSFPFDRGQLIRLFWLRIF